MKFLFDFSGKVPFPLIVLMLSLGVACLAFSLIDLRPPVVFTFHRLVVCKPEALPEIFPSEVEVWDSLFSVVPFFEVVHDKKSVLLPSFRWIVATPSHRVSAKAMVIFLPRQASLF